MRNIAFALVSVSRFTR
jgi:pimeloyl-ACP methyl ester carboxylesterase